MCGLCGELKLDASVPERQVQEQIMGVTDFTPILTDFISGVMDVDESGLSISTPSR